MITITGHEMTVDPPIEGWPLRHFVVHEIRIPLATLPLARTALATCVDLGYEHLRLARGRAPTSWSKDHPIKRLGLPPLVITPGSVALYGATYNGILDTAVEAAESRQEDPLVVNGDHAAGIASAIAYGLAIGHDMDPTAPSPSKLVVLQLASESDPPVTP